MVRRSRVALLVAAALLAACGGDGGGGGGGGSTPGPVRALTWNLYLGTGVEALFTPSAALDPAAAVRALHAEVQASDPAGRMDRVAALISAKAPDLVGLQEAARFATTQPPALGEVVEYDFVALVLAGLRARGATYRLVSQSVNFDQQVPDGTGTIVHFTDRDAILARDGVATRDAADARFTHLLQVPFGALTFAVPRGWCAVTADVGGTSLRFLSTHLEAVSDPVQEAQAGELAQLVTAQGGAVVVAGDLNSAADRSTTTSYATVRSAGLDDPWESLHPGDPGLTCCWAPDLRSGAFTSRIDVLLDKGPFTASAAEIVGEEAADRTASGLAPSDHAGVSATWTVR